MNMSSKWLVIAVAAMLTSASFGAEKAAESASGGSSVTPNLDEGTKVLEGSGSIDGDNPLGTDVQLQLGYGYFIADGLEVAAIGGFRDNDEFTTYEAGARIEYNIILDSAVVPFVGAGILWVGAEADETDESNDTAVGRFSAGLKWFIRNDVALTFSAVYDIAADDIYIDEDGNLEDDNFTGLFGIRYYFD